MREKRLLHISQSEFDRVITLFLCIIFGISASFILHGQFKKERFNTKRFNTKMFKIKNIHDGICKRTEDI